MHILNIKSWRRAEWWGIFIIVIFLLVLTTLPYILLFLYTPAGQIYGWTTFLNPGDNYVYYSYIDQVKSGSFLVNNLYTNEITKPTLQFFWLFVGLVARVFKANPVIIFHVFRLLLIPVFVFGMNACMQIFIPKMRQRILALAIFFFTSGLGWLYVLFRPLFWIHNEWQNVPFDILSTDAFPFLSILASPHFIFSWILLIFALIYGYLAIRDRKTSKAIIGGLFSLALFLMHPFFIPLVYIIIGLYSVSQYVINQSERFNILRKFLLLVSWPLPAVVYYIYLYFFDWATQVRAMQNLLISPSLWLTILSFGILLLLTIFGLYSQYKKQDQKQQLLFLSIWASVVLVMLYIPFLWQRRFVEGWYFPLSILASYGIWFIKDRKIFIKHFSIKYIFFTIIGVMLLLSNLMVLFLNQNFYNQHLYRFYYVDKDFMRVADFVKSETPINSTFLLNDEVGFMTFPYLADRHEYVGHIVESIYVHNKTQRLHWFFGTEGLSQTKYDFLLAEGIDYIIYNSEVDNFNIYKPEISNNLQLNFTSGNYSLYQVL